MTMEDSRSARRTDAVPDEDDEKLSAALHTDADDDGGILKSGNGLSAPRPVHSAAVVTSASAGMEKLVGLLTVRERELRLLQKAHDEYVKSSCDYEKELEGEVERYEKKLHAMESHTQSLDETKKQLQSAHAQMQQDLQTATKREHALLSQVQELRVKIQRLEQTNDELETANRVSQASIDELQHKVDTLSEENVFILQEKEDASVAAAAAAASSVPPQRDREGEGKLRGLTRRVSDATGPEPANNRKSLDKRKSGRFPDVVESCLHMTCSGGTQCRHSGGGGGKHPQHSQSEKSLTSLTMTTATSATAKTKRKSTGFFDKLRHRLARA